MGNESFRFGGKGMLIKPVMPCRLALGDNDELVVFHGDTEVARFTPGETPATWPVWDTPTRASFGARGPRLVISNGMKQRDVFTDIEARLPESPWVVVCNRIAMHVPRGAVLHSPEGEDYFELHAGDKGDESISLRELQVPADIIDLEPNPGQAMLQKGEVVPGTQFAEVAFDRDGEPWRQVMICAPLDKLSTLLVRAAARSANADALFDAARHVATSAGRIG